MTFITLGSQKFQFNRLLEKIDKLIDEKVILDEVYAQIGYSDYVPRNYEYSRFLDQAKFIEIMKKSNIIITHGGTGAIINAVKAKKMVIAVPRLVEFGEHVDNHQIQILKVFEEMNLILPCYDINELAKDYQIVIKKEFANYKSNTQVIIDSIEKYIEQVRGVK